jgi:hypothetical protein
MKLPAVVALLVLLAGIADPQQPVDPFAVPNAMATAYNEWGALYTHRIATVGMDGVDLQEQRAFARLVDRMNDLKKFAKSQYQ